MRHNNGIIHLCANLTIPRNLRRYKHPICLIKFTRKIIKKQTNVDFTSQTIGRLRHTKLEAILTVGLPNFIFGIGYCSHGEKK